MLNFVKSIFLALALLGMGPLYAQSAPSGISLVLHGNRAVGSVLNDLPLAIASGAVFTYLPGEPSPFPGSIAPISVPVGYKPVSVPTPSGGTIPGTAKVPIPRIAYAKSIARALPVIGNVAALVALADDMGLTISPQGEVLPALESNPYPVSDGYSYTGQVTQGYYRTYQQVCDATIAWHQSVYSSQYSFDYDTCTETTVNVRYYSNSTFWMQSNFFIRRESLNPDCPAGYLVLSDRCVQPIPPAPMTEQQIADHINNRTDWPPSIREALKTVLSLSAPARDAFMSEVSGHRPQMSLPGSSQTVDVGEPKVVTRDYTDSNGVPHRETKTEKTTATAQDDSVIFNTVTTTTVTNLNTNITNTTTTTTSPKTATTNSDGVENPVCGLPSTPACRIDETGTPEPQPDTMRQDVEQSLSETKTFLQNIQSALPSLPALNWGFSLPSSCGTIAMPGFAVVAPSLASIDMCQYQSMAHDIMGMIWAAAGLFAAVSMVFRDSTKS